MSDTSVSANNRFACAIRHVITYGRGASPVACLNKRAKWAGLVCATAASVARDNSCARCAWISAVPWPERKTAAHAPRTYAAPRHDTRRYCRPNGALRQRRDTRHHCSGYTVLFSHGPLLSFRATGQCAARAPWRGRPFGCLTALWPDRWRVTLACPSGKRR